MGLTELFNEWIVERGSAKVQEKHIALFRDQLMLADKKISILEAKIAELETENANLKSALQESQKEAEILRSKIQEYDQLLKKPSHDNLLDESKLEILQLLFKQPRSSIEKIAYTLNKEFSLIEFHLTDLRKTKRVKQEALPSNTIITPIVWSLDQEGTRYLIEHGLTT